MSDEKRIVEGVGRARFKVKTPGDLAGVSVITKVKVEKYNDKGELVETVIEEAEKNGDH